MNTSTQQKSYVRYTGLFNKVCQSPIFLVLAGLCSLYCVFALITFLTGLSGGIIAIILNGLPTLFAVLTTIGLWMMYLGAKKNDIGAGNLGLIATLPKWNKVIKTIIVVCAIILILVVVALLFMISSAASGTVNDANGLIGEIEKNLKDFGLPAESIAPVKDALNSIAFILTAGPIVILIAGIIVAAIMIIEIVRFSALCKFLGGAKKMYKTGHMVAPPTSFFVITTFIFAGYGVIMNIGVVPLTSFNLAGLLYPVMMVIVGIIFLQNKDELADIYATWQSEIGMINPGVAQAAPAAATVAPTAEAEAPAEENNTDAE